MRISLLLLSLSLLSGSAIVPGQTPGSSKPRDLSGTWISSSDPNATDVATASQLPNALLKITADGTRFALERSWSGAPIAATFVCDGRENANSYSIVVERTTCRWDPAGRGQLVIEGSIGRAEGPPTGRLRERYRIDAEGILHVERSREVFSTDRGATVTNSRYRRVLDPKPLRFWP